MSAPLISVIVPVYNVEASLPKCLDSILTQTYSNFELILIDDGSTDGSGRICDTYAAKEPRIKTIHQKNSGTSSARNRGIEIINGQFVVFVDSDDYVAEDYLSYLLSLSKEFKADLSICNYYDVWNKCIRPRKKNNKLPFCTTGMLAAENMLYTKDFDSSPCGKMYDSALLQDFRFPEDNYYEDVASIYKIVLKSKCVAISREPKYYYVKRFGSKVTSRFTYKNLDMLKACEGIYDDIKSKNPVLLNAATRKLVYACFYILKTIGNEYEEYPEVCSELKKIILSNRRTVLSDRKAPFRDKTAILSISLGLKSFMFFWNTYCLLTGRQV